MMSGLVMLVAAGGLASGGLREEPMTPRAGGASFDVVLTPPGAPEAGTLMHVSDLGVGFVNVGGPNRQGVAFVWVQDEFGQPVNGAVVTGTWSGCTSQANDSATTQTWYNSAGVVTNEGLARIDADKKRSCWGNNPCHFVFTVTNVTKAGMTYDPGSNVLTSNSSPCW